jgi:SAM-dependent methyltransferase
MQDVKQQYLDFFSSDEGAKKYALFKEILYGKDDSLVAELFDRIVPFLPQKEQLNILDIGGGDASRLKKIIALLKERGYIVSATIVEPSKSFARSLLLSSDFKKSKIKLRPSKFEDFLSEEKFDLIFLIHSIYTFRDKKYISMISSLLSKGGKVFVVSNGSDSILKKIKQFSDADSAEKRNEIDSVTLGLEEAGFQTTIFDWKINYSGIFDSTGFTKKGQGVLEVVALSDFAQISPNVQSAALLLFMRNSKDGVVFDNEVLVIAEK